VQATVTRAGLHPAECAAWAALPAALLIAVAWLALSDVPLPVSGSMAWMPALGVDLAFRIDGLGLLMLLMISAVGLAVFVYAAGYFAGDARLRRLYRLLVVFMVAMVGCVTADHVVLLFLFWEATSITSFLLVGFDHAREDSRKSAQQALLVTGAGGLALLAGLLLLASELGTGAIGAIVERLATATPTPRLHAAMLLLVAGAFTKSAQVPFHFWLPNAMAAPTPVSAYLHSATMVKLGVFLLARMSAGFEHWPAWQGLLQTVGSITAAWAMVLALRERDLKRILAWSTVATLGTLTMLIGVPGPDAAVAVGALLLAHALYKAPLFFVAGNIDHATGTRQIDRLGNLRHAMPWTAAAALLAGLSMAGVPLSFGFVAKTAALDAKASDAVLQLARAANVVFGAVAVAVAGVAAVRVFWRHPGTNETPAAHEVGPALLLPPMLLATAGIVLGLVPLLVVPLLADAGYAMLPGSDPVAVRLRGLAAPALASFAVTVGIGLAVFRWWEPLHARIDALVRRYGHVSMAAQYQRALAALPRVAGAVSRTLQHGRQSAYLALVFGVVTLALAAALVAARLPLSPGAWPLPGAIGVGGGCGLAIAGALVATRVRGRLAALAASGLVGYGTAVVCLYSGAPDVAMTQFLVETVFIVVAASVLLLLERETGPEADRTPLRGAWPIAVGFGAVLAVAALAITGLDADRSLAELLAARSVPDAHGRNVVNVILVDFRALDTLGEISVVLVSLLAALPLLAWTKAPSR
jgi:multicomponent Na+:H+ antiporter subunit A